MSFAISPLGDIGVLKAFQFKREEKAKAMNAKETVFFEKLQPLSFPSAALRYFGQLPGQSLLQFASELKTLSPQDRQELRAMLSVALKVKVEP